MFTRLMAIDPGLQGTGVAIWTKQGARPTMATVIRGRGKTWIDRVDHVANEVYELAVEHDVRSVISEMMEMHQSPRAQMMWKTGDLQRTIFLIGSIHGMCTGAGGVVHFTVTPPSEWKGQLPKGVTIRRIVKLLGERAVRDLEIQTHAWDAVGIGLWHLGYLK